MHTLVYFLKSDDPISAVEPFAEFLKLSAEKLLRNEAVASDVYLKSDLIYFLSSCLSQFD